MLQTNPSPIHCLPLSVIARSPFRRHCEEQSDVAIPPSKANDEIAALPLVARNDTGLQTTRSPRFARDDKKAFPSLGGKPFSVIARKALLRHCEEQSDVAIPPLLSFFVIARNEVTRQSLCPKQTTRLPRSRWSLAMTQGCRQRDRRASLAMT